MLVSVLVSTYNSARYIREALDSVLAQTFQDFEVVVVDDGSTDGTADIVLGYRDPRIRWISKEHSGIPDTYNRAVAEARGELLARLGHDDRMNPYRLELQVAAMQRHPDVGVVHSDAVTIDRHGRVIGRWLSLDYSKEDLDKLFFRVCNNLIDPSTMVRRAVYDEVAGYDLALPMCNDFDFWLRASARWRFLHLPLPLLEYRRHGGNFSDEGNKALERAEVATILERMATRYRTLRELVPEIDWDAPGADEQAKVLAHELLTKRGYPGLADRLFGGTEAGTEAGPTRDDGFQVEAESLPEAGTEAGPTRDDGFQVEAEILPGAGTEAGPTRDDGFTVDAESRSGAGTKACAGQRILMVMYGWAESGGGTILPRSIAKELVARGHEVCVFYAGVAPMPDKPPYHLHRHEEDGVLLRGLFNRPHVFTDLSDPLREIEDPPITAAFREVLDEFRPDVVHVHNLHNLGAALAGEIGRRGLRGFFTPHNYWLVCPRLYLFQGDMTLCEGPGTGARCGECAGHPDNHEAYAERRARLRDLFIESGLTCLAVSGAVRDVLVGNGFPADRVRVFYQGHRQADRLWAEVGAKRPPRAPRAGVVFSFIGSALYHKGVQLLVAAAQTLRGQFEVRVHGDGAPALQNFYRSLDPRGVVRHMGPYSYDEMPDILRSTDVAIIPSIWYDNAPLAVNECLAARVPVLGAEMGGIPEFLAPGLTGDVFAARDADSLARRMQEIIDRPETVAQWQRNIAAPISFETYVSRLEDLYAGEDGTYAEVATPTTVTWEGTQFAYHSLSHINREVCSALLASPDIRLSLVPYEPPQFLPDGNPVLEALEAAHGRALGMPAKVHVRHMWPPRWDPPASGAWVLLQPWEYGCIPAEWIAPIKAGVDEIWTPSTYSKEAFVKVGIPEERIVVIPNGVDTRRYRPDGPRYPLATGKGTRFLFVGGTIPRKGIDAVLKAYVAAFKAHDDVCLVIKSSGIGTFYQDSPIGEQIAALRALPETPEIEVIEQDLSDDEIAALYRACDALVMPYRAEGFCMPIAEAMASGLGVIASDFGACLDFCDATTTYLVPAQEYGAQIRYLPPPAIEYTLCEPDVVAIARYLKRIVANPAEARAMGARGRERIVAGYTWAHVAAMYEERLHALATRVPRRFGADYLDPVRFGPGVAPVEIEGLRGCNFLARPDWAGEGWQELLAAYLGAFRPTDDVTLVLRTDPEEAGSADRIMAFIDALGYDPERIPDVVLVDHALTTSRAGGLYTACQVFVDLGHPTFLREAEACGLAIVNRIAPEALRAAAPAFPEAA
ncbi:MAG: glycosyltransferase [Candidatus Sericytochromatia bacterium]|nr:glycosyltransferase [Candidatus Tanganyikabacteria bacterium]